METGEQTNTTEVAATSVTALISSYPILTTLASWISVRDLTRLGRTCRAHHAYILASPPILKALTRQSTCSGLGLVQRNDHYLLSRAGRLSINPFFDGDAEIEVRLFNVKCDEAGALPCVDCGVNICEECRYYPRADPPRSSPNRRPHLNSAWQTGDVMAFCGRCDVVVEEEIREKNYLNELCDCDLYTRWWCRSCCAAAGRVAGEYQSKHTKSDHYWDDPVDEDEDWPGTKVDQDHQFERAFWCPCGSSVPQDQRFRCAWCKRRHLPEEEWGKEWREVGSRLPFFENNPDYPRFPSGNARKYPNPYPKLGYERPGDVSEHIDAAP